MHIRNKKYLFAISIILSLWIFLSFNVYAFHSNGRYKPIYDTIKKDTPIATSNQKIILKHADILTYNKRLRNGVQVLVGNVEFQHGNATMTCDSAYLNDASQEFQAFDNVHMIQDDTINIYANYLLYNGYSKMAYLRENVVLRNTSTTLYTDSLDYDRVRNIAYYFNGGSIVDSTNTLTSNYGEYDLNTKDAEFTDSVNLVNKNMTMTTEHLIYNTGSQISRILGPTKIVSDSGIIYSTRGVYDTKNNVGILLDRSRLVSDDKTLIGDSIYYDANKKVGEAFGNVVVIDTAQHLELHGDYGYFDGVKNYVFATSRSYAVDFSNKKDSTYISADTLELISLNINKDEIAKIKVKRWQRDSINIVQGKLKKLNISDSISLDSISVSALDSLKSLRDSINKINKIIIDSTRGEFIDSIKVDTIKRILRAYHKVKMYSLRGQAKSDSLSYNSIDSVLKLFNNSLLWRDNSQISADTISHFFKDKQLDSVLFRGAVFSIQHIDSVDLYNQIKATQVVSFIKNSEIRKIDATGDVQSIYYIYDDQNKAYSGLNRMNSKTMVVYFADSSKLKKVFWAGPVTAKAYPISMSNTASVNRLDGFNWDEKARPKDKYDVIDTISTDSNVQNRLIDLKRFSGAIAIVKAYEELQPQNKKQLDSVSKEDKDITSKDSLLNQSPISYWVLRDSINKEDKTINVNNIISDLWHFHSTTPEKQNLSNTNPYIGIPERRNYRKE